jgi:peptidyl-prolyl cis-trans isomerase D
VANAEGAEPAQRVLLRVDQVTAPAFTAEGEDAQFTEQQLAEAIESGIRRAYYADLLQSRDIDLNNAVLAQLTGSVEQQ